MDGRRPETRDEAVARLLASRITQGLPPTVTDPVVLATIATIVMQTRSEAQNQEARMDRKATPKPMPERDETRDNGVGSVG